MNVLLTAVGRRSYLVRYFQEALAGRGRVLATNSVAEAPGLQAADQAFVVPPSYEKGYADVITALCREHQVGLLCSCHDLDTLALAPQRERLRQAGVTPVLPSSEWARLCLDKWECGVRLREAGFTVPWTSLSPTETAVAHGEACFPLLVKSRHGFGSFALARCDDRDELTWLHRRAVSKLRDSTIHRFIDIPAETAVLVQEEILGPELRIVLVHDLDGNYAAHFITEVHAMRAGETDRATTLPPDVLGDLPLRLSAWTKHIGVWGIDIRMANGRPVILDLNPRFTGDYPFQHLAGADIPAALIAWAQGGTPDPAWLQSEAGVSGFKDLVPVRDRQAG